MPVKSHGGVLVVEDNEPLRLALVSALRGGRFGEVRSAASVAECETALASFAPALVLLDVALGDGDAFDIIRQLDMLPPPTPAVVAVSGSAAPDVAFRLAQLGVRSYFDKPLDLERIEQALEQALESALDLRPQLLASLGRVPLPELEERVRNVLLKEAIVRSRGNRRGAARLLSISRQLLQHMLRKLPPISDAS